jgi:3-deoxy-D-manno-octulosonic-acid transferase
MPWSGVPKVRIVADSLPMTLRVYRSLSSAVVPLAPALIRQRLRLGKEDPERSAERRGLTRDVRPPGPLVWIHGASVGEVLAAAALIQRLRQLNLRILVTSGTVTSAAIVARRFPPDVIHQYVPYDSPRFVARFLDHWRPSLALFIESDLWPNLILSSAARRVPMVLINGRMSQRSFPRWQKVASTISALLGTFDICLAQSPTDAKRFAALGCHNVITTGNLKLDVPAPPADPDKLDKLLFITRGRPIIIAASTHPGEEEILIEVHKALAGFFPSLLTVIVPRHPSRGEAIVQTIAAAGLTPAQRSHEDLPTAVTDIYVADTLGELGLFYRLAPIVFMGGSLASHGGQNPIEPIKLGAAILHGPHVWNFAEIYADLDKAHGAEQVADVEELAQRASAWLKNAGERMATVSAARAMVATLGGGLGRTLAALEPYLMQIRLERRASDA